MKKSHVPLQDGQRAQQSLVFLFKYAINDLLIAVVIVQVPCCSSEDAKETYHNACRNQVVCTCASQISKYLTSLLPFTAVPHVFSLIKACHGKSFPIIFGSLQSFQHKFGNISTSYLPRSSSIALPFFNLVVSRAFTFK